jgi:hypothetical protein
MNSTTINKISDRLRILPDYCEADILAYISFLNFKSKEEDWASDMSDKDLNLIKKGALDASQGQVYSHAEAMKRIEKYIQSKRK